MMKTIWMYWDSGLGNAPELVRQCVQSWQKYNSAWQLNILDDSSYSAFVDVDCFRVKPIKVQAFSDILRIHLLEQYGGVWVDATCFCTRPLDEWIYHRQRNGFFLFKNPTPRRPVCTWFLYAEIGNPVVRAWKDRTREYWLETMNSYPYFWFHSLFTQMLQNHCAVRKTFDQLDYDARVGCRDYANPHYYACYGDQFLNCIDEEYRINIGQAPLYKLNKRLDTTSAKISHLMTCFLE